MGGGQYEGSDISTGSQTPEGVTTPGLNNTGDTSGSDFGGGNSNPSSSDQSA
jgi:hypothetical protein